MKDTLIMIVNVSAHIKFIRRDWHFMLKLKICIGNTDTNERSESIEKKRKMKKRKRRGASVLIPFSSFFSIFSDFSLGLCCQRE